MINQKAERRAHKRLTVKKGAFALLRTSAIDLNRIKEMSMGEIACSVLKSDVVKIGQIKDASKSGLSFYYFRCNGGSEAPMKLDILDANEDFFLPNISYKIVSDVKMPDQLPFGTFELRQICIQFQGMDMGKKLILEKFIKNHTTFASR